MRKLNNYKIIGSKVEIELTQGQVATIDLKDLPLVYRYKWYALKGGNNFYAQTNVRKPDGKQAPLKLHQLLMQTPVGLHTDHIDHNGLNNCRSNLRICTASENAMNSRSKRNSTSKFKGVSWAKHVNKWIAQIKVNNKKKHLGYFISEQDAADAYNLAAKDLFGEYANLNGIY